MVLKQGRKSGRQAGRQCCEALRISDRAGRKEKQINTKIASLNHAKSELTRTYGLARHRSPHHAHQSHCTNCSKPQLLGRPAWQARADTLLLPFPARMPEHTGWYREEPGPAECCCVELCLRPTRLFRYSFEADIRTDNSEVGRLEQRVVSETSELVGNKQCITTIASATASEHAMTNELPQC